MKILALSDRVVESVYSTHLRRNYGDVDIVVGCGDLPYYYLEFVVSSLDKPTLYVRGNHDAGVQYTSDGRRLTAAEGAQLIEGTTLREGDLLFAGLGGSMRYQSDARQQYTEAEMRGRITAMLPRLLRNRLRHGRFVDVLVTHSPPHGIHDRHDRAHTGFKAFLTFMSRFKPRYLLHGHSHVWRQDEITETVYEETTILNVYPVRVLEIPSPEGLS